MPTEDINSYNNHQKNPAGYLIQKSKCTTELGVPWRRTSLQFCVPKYSLQCTLYIDRNMMGTSDFFFFFQILHAEID